MPMSLSRVVMLVVLAMVLIVSGDAAAKHLSVGGFDPTFLAWSRFALAAVVVAPFAGLVRSDIGACDRLADHLARVANCRGHYLHPDRIAHGRHGDSFRWLLCRADRGIRSIGGIAERADHLGQKWAACHQFQRCSDRSAAWFWYDNGHGVCDFSRLFPRIISGCDAVACWWVQTTVSAAVPACGWRGGSGAIRDRTVARHNDHRAYPYWHQRHGFCGG